MVMFYVEKNIKDAPVRIVIYLPRQLYEEALNGALSAGFGNLEKLIISLLENFVEELKAEGYDLRPFWEKEKGEVEI